MHVCFHETVKPKLMSFASLGHVICLFDTSFQCSSEQRMCAQFCSSWLRMSHNWPPHLICCCDLETLHSYPSADIYVQAFFNIWHCMRSHARLPLHRENTAFQVSGGCGSHAVFHPVWQFHTFCIDSLWQHSHVTSHCTNIELHVQLFQAGSVSAARVSSGSYPRISDCCTYQLCVHPRVSLSYAPWQVSEPLGSCGRGPDLRSSESTMMTGVFICDPFVTWQGFSGTECTVRLRSLCCRVALNFGDNLPWSLREIWVSDVWQTLVRSWPSLLPWGAKLVVVWMVKFFHSKHVTTLSLKLLSRDSLVCRCRRAPWLPCGTQSDVGVISVWGCFHFGNVGQNDVPRPDQILECLRQDHHGTLQSPSGRALMLSFAYARFNSEFSQGRNGRSVETSYRLGLCPPSTVCV